MTPSPPRAVVALTLTLAFSCAHTEDFGIHGPDAFEYCSKGECFTVDGVDDAKEFAEVRHAMDVIGITKNEQYEIFRLLAAILWMGNIEFREGGTDKAEVSDMAGTSS